MAQIIHATLHDAKWVEPGNGGPDYAPLRRHTDGIGATILLRFAAGAVGANHLHPEGEELFVISGDITIGGRRLGPGDYLYTPPGAAHEAVAHADTLLLLSFPVPPVFPPAA